MRKKTAAALGVALLGIAACSEKMPTGVDGDLLPHDLVTLEIRLPWDEFASNLQVFGGYGSPLGVGAAMVAHQYGPDLESRAVFRFSTMPGIVTVTDSAGTQRTDDQLKLIGGRIVAIMDSIQSTWDRPVTLEIGPLPQAWDPGSVSWSYAVDTAGVREPWSAPGGGPGNVLATTVWNPADGDSAVFALDSAQVEMWKDTTVFAHGVRLSTTTAGVRLKVNNVLLRGSVIPSVRPDTVADLTATRTGFTFVYSPAPSPVTEDIRIGGAPAWRTVLDLDLPESLNGPAALCAAVSCPLKLRPDQVSYAALVLKSRRGLAAFQPADSLGLDLRPVYDRSAMPKAPLGSSLLGVFGQRVGPGLFGDDEGSEVEFPITGFVRSLVAGDSIRGFPPAKSLALIALYEPSSLNFATFFGPGRPEAPVLKLIVTTGRTVELP